MHAISVIVAAATDARFYTIVGAYYQANTKGRTTSNREAGTQAGTN